MKTFIVMSDSHGRGVKAFPKLMPLFAENDFIVHLGDGAGEMRQIESAYPEKTYVCKGNCDFTYALDECVLEAEGVSILCCHGHKYGVKSGLTRLAERAKELGCAVALYGHTHVANAEEVNGVLCVNPGSLGDWSSPSYCYLVVHAGKATPTIVQLV